MRETHDYEDCVEPSERARGSVPAVADLARRFATFKRGLRRMKGTEHGFEASFGMIIAVLATSGVAANAAWRPQKNARPAAVRRRIQTAVSAPKRSSDSPRRLACVGSVLGPADQRSTRLLRR
jgi:hypothetical protein